MLQEDLPETNPRAFQEAAARIVGYAREHGWEVVFMACWPYDTGGRAGTTVYSDTMVIKEHRCGAARGEGGMQACVWACASVHLI